MTSGKFIVFEGGEGSGKSRHSKFVAEKLEADGYSVVYTHEPGGSEIGQRIREIILTDTGTPLHPRAELLLFLADRAQHVEQVIKPALEAGKIVICDRFSGSTFAYQLGARDLPDPDMIKRMDAYARGAISPDFVLYLDIDPEDGVQRKREAGQELNRLDTEQLAFHQRVREHFISQVKENENWNLYSTVGPKEENSQKIYELICKELNQ